MAAKQEVTNPGGAERRLEEMGLSAKTLLTALRRGQHAFDSATANHPRTAGGFYRWAETNRELRDALVPHGWRPIDEDNLPKIASPDGSFSFYAASGNEDTGLRGENDPSTSRPRGAAGKRDVMRNQLELFPHLLPAQVPQRTWILLYFHDTQNDVTRSELSLPYEVGDDGNILSLAKRIILPIINLTPRLERGSDDDEEDVYVPVKRRPS